MTDEGRTGLDKLVRLLICLLLSATHPAVQGTTTDPSAGGAVQAEEPSWPGLRGPRRDGISDETGWLSQWPPEGPRLLWETGIGSGYSAVSIWSGRVYTMGHRDGEDSVYSLDPDSGDVNWQVSYRCPPMGKNQPDGGPACTPTVDDDAVYTMSRKGHLYAIEPVSGDVKWAKPLMEEFGAEHYTYGFTCSPWIEQDLLIVDAGMTMAFNKFNGELVWKSNKYVASYCSPIVLDTGNRRSLTAFNGSGFFILDIKDGTELCRKEWSSTGLDNVNAAVPIIDGERIFLSSTYNRGWGLLRFDPANPSLSSIWEGKHEAHRICNDVLWKGALYGSDGGALQCMEMETGKIHWTEGGFGKASLMLAGERLIILSEQGELLIVRPSRDGYHELARIQVLGGVSFTAPVLCGKRIYCRNSRGDLVCVDVDPAHYTATATSE